MEITKNGLKKPAQDDFYNVDDFNNNTDIVEEHLENKDIHVSASEIGNIKEAEELTQIVNSDDNSKMWGKIKKLITDFLNHIKTTATGSVLGHVKLSDTYAAKVANGAAKDGLGASQNALYEAYNKLNTDLNNIDLKLKESMLAIPATTTSGISVGGFNFSLDYIKGKNYIRKDANGNGTMILEAGTWLVFIKLQIPNPNFSAEVTLNNGTNVNYSNKINNEQQDTTFVLNLTYTTQIWLCINCTVQGLKHYGDIKYSYVYIQKVFN